MMYGMPILLYLERRSLLNQQAIANRGSIESLIPRVEGLAESLITPAPEDEVKEIKRRQKLKE
jgi:hypothetical protein